MEKPDRIVTFATYYDPMLAQIIKGRLEANDIPCYLADENINTIMPIYNQMTGGVKLRVFTHDLEKAKLLIAADDSLEIEDGPSEVNAVRCPYCGSSNVKFGPATERKHSWLGIIVSFLANDSLFYIHLPVLRK